MKRALVMILALSGCYMSHGAPEGVDCERQPEMCPPDPCSVDDVPEYAEWREHFGCDAHDDAS